MRFFCSGVDGFLTGSLGKDPSSGVSVSCVVPLEPAIFLLLAGEFTVLVVATVGIWYLPCFPRSVISCIANLREDSFRVLSADVGSGRDMIAVRGGVTIFGSM